MLSARRIRREVEFSCNPRVRLGKTRMFPAFRVSDWTKHGCFWLSVRRIRQNTNVSRFPRVRLDKTRMFLAFRAADWTKHECFPLSARRIGQNTDVSRFPHGGFDEKSVFRRAEKDAPRRRQSACGAGLFVRCRTRLLRRLLPRGD